MAVVKANYVKWGRGAKARAKATLRYIQHRPGKEGERVTRKLFGPDGVLDRQQAYRMIDEAKQGTLFFRIIISPDPRLEDTKRDLDLWTLMTKTMELFEEKLKNEKRLHGAPPWLAVEHNDHARSRHLHVMMLFQGKLSREDIAALRQMATEVTLEQRWERDLTLAAQRQQERRFVPQWVPKAVPMHPWEPQAKPLTTLKTCPACGELQAVSRGQADRCHSCGASFNRQQGSSLGYEEAPWG